MKAAKICVVGMGKWRVAKRGDQKGVGGCSDVCLVDWRGAWETWLVVQKVWRDDN